MKKAIIALLLICVAGFAQQKGTFTDSRDGKTYKTVKIGEQVWMAQNLDYHGEDGYLGLCYGDEPKKKIKKPENCKKYGRLYDWNEAMKACPEGWHLPSREEWKILVDFAGGGGVAGKKLKAKSGWEKYDFSWKSPKSPKCKWTVRTEEQIDNRGRVTSPAGVTEYDMCSTDEYGFSALPGGYYSYTGDFYNVGSAGLWWSSSEHGSSGAYYRNMSYSSTRASIEHFDSTCGLVCYSGKSCMLSVRCLQITEEQKAMQEATQQKNTFTDSRDGKKYKTVKIGEQIWMAENLNHDTEGSKCYGYHSTNCAKYGRLYNWKTAMKACPSGWHLPSKSEYEVLDKAVGGTNVADNKLKSESGWNNNGNGTDESGFSALPGGYGYSGGICGGTACSFHYVGDIGYWWSSTERNNNYAYYRGMGYAYDIGANDAGWKDRSKHDVFSVRCLLNDKEWEDAKEKEKAELETRERSFIDSRDEKNYKTIKIGSQTWMAENLNYDAEGSKCYSDDSANCTKYGRLYNWEMALKACPSGWHLPSKSEYEVLDEAVGGENVAAKKLKSKSGWNGTDEFGFSALSGGYGRSDGGFRDVGDYGYWWTTSDSDSDYAYIWYMDYTNGSKYANRYDGGKSGLFSVRCLQTTAEQKARQEQTQVEFPRVGLWKITGRDSENWTGSNLIIEEIDGEKFSGYFEWYRSGINYSGRENFRGVYNSHLKTVVIEGYSLVNASGIVLGTYEVYLSKNGYDFESGTWVGGGKWEAKWQK